MLTIFRGFCLTCLSSSIELVLESMLLILDVSTAFSYILVPEVNLLTNDLDRCVLYEGVGGIEESCVLFMPLPGAWL